MNIYMTYQTVDKPWGGANNFLRALKQELVSAHSVSFVDSPEQADIIFMNQLSSGPGAGSEQIPFSQLKKLRERSNAKIIMRAINLESHAYQQHLWKYILGGAVRIDRNIKKALMKADHVIFQSAYQQSFFENSGLKVKRSTIIHNGASSIFRHSGRILPLEEDETLILLSSTASKRASKNHALIAAFSKIHNVVVHHVGNWPENLDAGKVIRHGVLDHTRIVSLMDHCHYILHPASKDPCPNSLIEGLYNGLPALYSSDHGTGYELAGQFGIPLTENLDAVVNLARYQYMDLKKNLSQSYEKFGIPQAAKSYYACFFNVLKDESRAPL